MPTMSGLLDIRQIIIQFPFNRFVLRAERKSETFANAITVDRICCPIFVTSFEAYVSTSGDNSQRFVKLFARDISLRNIGNQSA